jgi:hypothetical protein
LLLAGVAFVILTGVLAARAAARAADRFADLENRLRRYEVVCVGSPGGCPSDLEAAVRARDELISISQTPIDTQDPVGALQIPVGLAASAPGLVFLAVLAAGYVGGEYERRTADSRFAREPRRWAFVLRKVMGCSMAVFCVVALAWLTTMLIGQAFRLIGDLPEPEWAAARSRGLEGVLRLLIVTPIMSCVFVLLGVLIRRQLATFATVVAGSVALAVTSNLNAVCALSPACWLAGWMAFERRDFGTSMVWVALPQASAPYALIGLIAIGAAAAVAATKLARPEARVSSATRG